MLLKYFYDSHLAQASYLVACQATGDAIVIDPSRDINPYLEAARKDNLRIVGAAETHIHADFVSGARELAERGATLYLSDAGPEPWKSFYAKDYANHMLHDGDSFMIGNLKFEVMHTPGHTPEHIAFLLTDTPATSEPLGIFSGDFVFVGSVGRPDLLEKAVGEANSAEKGAKQMFASLARFRALPDFLQVWPGHGAGSSCGKGLGAVPSSTVGYEKLANPFVRETNEAAFVSSLLEGQPEPPTYFATMKKVNREGPHLMKEVSAPETLDLQGVLAAVEVGAVVVDTRPAAEFAKRHLPKVINIPVGALAEWGGWLLPYDRPIVLLTPQGGEVAALHPLRAIGFDNVVGIADSAVVEAANAAGMELLSYPNVTAQEAAELIEGNRVTVVDVRKQNEWDEGHLAAASHLMLGDLPRHLDEIPTDKPIVLQCRSGARSAIAASILQANGITNVMNLSGGIQAWQKAGLAVEK